MNPWEEEVEAKRKSVMERANQAKADGPEACLRLSLELIAGYTQEEVGQALAYINGAQLSAFVLGDIRSQALIATASVLLWQAWKGAILVKEEGK